MKSRILVIFPVLAFLLAGLTATAAKAADTSVTVSVPAIQPWNDTGVFINAGDSVSITAAGIIKIAGSDPGKTPAGGVGCIAGPGVAGGGWLADGLTCWSLIGRIGNNPAFEVGTGTSFTATDSGELFLSVDDNYFPDNSGAWTATITTGPAQCPQGTKANFRWHYSADGSAGGWSGTKTEACPGPVTMGPQAMGGNLIVSPGDTILAGYDFTLPGNNSALTLTVSSARVVFAVACVSGATPAEPSFAVTMADQSYSVTSSQWYPSGDQSSPLVYQGSAAVPDLCAGGQLSLHQGGTFTATLS